MGASMDSDVFPLLMEGVLGVDFRFIDGYPGSTEIDNAMERGEVDGQLWLVVEHPYRYSHGLGARGEN